ncbi:TauD/TfdA family dioxygenase [Microbulbifer taiwanensis]|uniref:TauD/TfdA family dioxygenase n=1 Tax=Microbulbifer taiwanensis TaxID=986746 RepID=A0ABW1YSK9_9GAMM|nr:TauD/TfdA family dioxygenase [Microbulbifer taiwanensis]
MHSLHFTKQNLVQTQDLIQVVMEQYETAEDGDFLRDAYLWAADLPDEVRRVTTALKTDEYHDGILHLKGYRFRRPLRPTPRNWTLPESGLPDQEADFLGVLLSTLLGDVFGFETQQDGKLIHDVMPVKGMEFVQSGSSSLANLSYHTEDAFHPHRGEFLVFCYLRNPNRVGTELASIHQFELPDSVHRILTQPRFFVVPDNTHSVGEEFGERTPVLFGPSDRPFIRFDPDFTHACHGDNEAEMALQVLDKSIKSVLFEVPAEPGDFLVIDNCKVVHGRRPFQARFDQEDRWLKRFNINLDLKRAAPYRRDMRSRLLSAAPVGRNSA